jgi:3-hydroxyisobutyrate dehydrogenase
MIEMSTTDENEMIKLSKLCAKKGIETLEAPITGGQHRAETGNIGILVAGKRKNFDRAFPILSVIGHEILYCGKIGNASTLKVVTNYLASINLLALGEALMVCKKYGVDLTKAFYGIKISSGNSFVHETESKVILNGSYDVGFTMELVCKDIGLFNKLTDKFKIPAQLSKLTNSIFEEGRLLYGDKAFSTSIVKKLEDKCNDDLRAEGFPEKLIDEMKLPEISAINEIQKEIEMKHASILDERPVPNLLETADLIDSLKDLKAPPMGKLYEEKVKKKPDLNKNFTAEE